MRWKLMVAGKQINAQVINQKIIGFNIWGGFNKDMFAVGIFGFKVGDIFGFRLDQPSAFSFIKDGKAAIVFKKTVYFL